MKIFNKYTYLFLGIIVLATIIILNFIPDLETEEFDQEVIDDIIEGVTTTLATEDEFTIQWADTQGEPAFPGNAKIVFNQSGTNGHDTSFDFTPVHHTTISSRISNRKTANDDWQDGPRTIIEA